MKTKWTVKLLHPLDKSETYRILLSNNETNDHFSYSYTMLKQMVNENRLYEVPGLAGSMDKVSADIRKIVKHIEQRLL